jgi:hypothetical protein
LIHCRSYAIMFQVLRFSAFVTNIFGSCPPALLRLAGERACSGWVLTVYFRNIIISYGILKEIIDRSDFFNTR